ncbi:MAG: class I SAM-dependent methyltransferase, partial [Chloroflexi bacterium]|nr:class I SAM-dependent methyltransferase [Chloroflexota bacterium]
IALTLVEPSPAMRNKLKKRVFRLGKQVEIVSSKGEILPFPDDSFDSIVSTLVLCSVSDLNAVLAEINRVLKPDGAFYFYEHVAAGKGVTRLFQNVLNPMWKMWARGCNLNRDIEADIQKAGFSLVEVTRFGMPISPPINRPSIVGVAWA